MKSLLPFGEEISGYPVRVINERAVRAGAGILFALAMMSFMNAYLLGNYQPTRLFVIVFLIDMTLRMLNPRWAPSMIVGQWVVRNQTPEWVGAPQKRFAWGLGIALGLVMLNLMVLNQRMGPLNMLVCGSCLTLMFFESAFGICLGCKLYNLFNKEQAQLCPGGVCEVPVRGGGAVRLKLGRCNRRPHGRVRRNGHRGRNGPHGVFRRGGIGRRRTLHPAVLRRMDRPRRQVEAAQPLPMI